MQVININEADSGQRFDKFLKRYFKNASASFIYKMLRKKNITLNAHKAEGTEILKAGDVVNTFFSDETFEKFSGTEPASKTDIASVNNGNSVSQETLSKNIENAERYLSAYRTIKNVSIIYENSDYIILGKPAGLLCQNDSKESVSLNDWLLGYAITELKISDFRRFKPSICNRIDRNTSGIVLAALSYKGSRVITELIRNHQIKKEYLAICEGVITKGKHLKGYIKKDSENNKVTILENQIAGSEFIETIYAPVGNNGKYTLLNIEIITGKSHQIRAHMASIGHPLAGDSKYGGHRYKKYNYQMLHANKVTFLTDNELCPKNTVYLCDSPAYFQGIL